MQFRKMVTMTLYVRRQKRHRCKEQSFGLWEKARVGWFERIALRHVYYHMWNRSPVQFQCMRQGGQGWYTGMTLRDGMGREMGGAFRTGTHMSACTLCLSKPICLEKLAIFSFTSIFPILEGNRAGFVSWCPWLIHVNVWQKSLQYCN